MSDQQIVLEIVLSHQETRVRDEARVLIVVRQTGQELDTVLAGAAGADHACTTGGGAGLTQGLGARAAVGGLGRVDLGEVGTHARGEARGTGDEVRVLLLCYGLASWVHPEHADESFAVSILDQAVRLLHLQVVEFGTDVDGEPHTHDVDSGVGL